MNKLLCFMWGHDYYSHYRLYISDDCFIDEKFKCRHCGVIK